MELLKVLLIVSYIIHCNANTIVCEPKDTSNPTTSPTTDPTPSPTREPITPLPTKNPFGSNNNNDLQVVPDIAACQWHPDQDVIILNDISCPITQQQCKQQQAMIGETILAIKSVYTPAYGDNNNNMRIAYFEFDAHDAYQVINLTDSELNHHPVDQQESREERENFYLKILQRQQSICIFGSETMTFLKPGYPALDKALEKAYNHFKRTNGGAKDRKTIIFSNCKADPISTIPDICRLADEYIYNHDNNNKFSMGNIVMVNNGNNFDIDDTYIPCLVEYDVTNRIFNNPQFDTDEWDKLWGLRYGIQTAICGHPTPAPTTDPTSDPTKDPTRDPTADPTIDPTYGYQIPQRRRLTHVNTFDITSGIGNSPCLTMEIKLETENLLPLNAQPDPASNIAIIGQAIANKIGVVTIPDTPIIDDGDDPNDFPFWQPFEFDATCDLYPGTPQMNQYYAPTNASWAPGSSTGFRQELTNPDRFEVLVKMSTADTAIYVYKFNKIPLNVFYTCDNNIILKCGIYDGNTLMGDTLAHKTISSSQETQTIEFEWMEDIELSGNTTYIIKFSGEYPSGCNSNNIILGNNARRRLQDSTATYLDGTSATESASACAAGNSLARSESMKAAVTAMCNTNQVDLSNVKEGLFRQHQSNSYVKDHLIKTGSITLIDPITLEEILNSQYFPQYNVQDPCIAVDEDENIIYAIGGKIDDNTAVNYIQACQLNANNLSEPCTIMDYTGEDINNNPKKFELDKPNYGATCLLWNSDGGKRLVVIGGMSNPTYEFQQTPAGKLSWYKDIRIYTIPELFDDDGNRLSASNVFIGSSAPEGKDINQARPVNDMKPLLVGSNLYTFGGKTHKASIWFVDKINLDDVYIGEGGWASQIYLEEKKALPMVDQTTWDGQGCYVAYSGQTYLNYVVSGDAENTDMFQLFCNSNIPSSRRRLNENENIKGLTDYDMMKLKQRSRRNLLDEKSEVVINKYKYGLDGIWYNFTVQFELCYNNNNELNDAVEYYNNVINEKPNGNEWIEYNQQISERILNCSLDAYEPWSNGFGAVNVWDLDMIDIRFEKEIDYTTHPKRRRARFWGHNIGNINENDDWIDKKFDYRDSSDGEKKKKKKKKMKKMNKMK